MNRHIFLLSVLLLSFVNLVSRGQAPKIVPTAPEAAALAKEVNYPLSYRTGAVNISVPLTQIQSGGMSLPIGLNYHAGGFRTNERSTNIGLGFSLSCDLQITRTINGLDDLHPWRGYLANEKITPYNPNGNNTNIQLCDNTVSQGQATYLNALASGEKDGAPDRFNYRLLNKSGSFYFTKGTPQIVTVPYDNTILVSYYVSPIDGRPSFKIVDSDGTTYYFERYREQQTEGSGDYPYTSWKCNKIENAAKTESFTFTWVSKSDVKTFSRLEKIVYSDDIDACAFPEYYTANEIEPWVQYFEDNNKWPLSSPQITEYFGDARLPLVHLPYLGVNNNIIDKTYPSRGTNAMRVDGLTTALTLSEISFRQGKVVFAGTDKLNSITLRDASGADVKTFQFTQSYSTPANLTEARALMGQNFSGTLYLDGITVIGQAITEQYSFQYAQKFCFGDHLKGKDVWGYVNDYTSDLTASTPELVPMSVPQKKITQRVIKDSHPCVTADNITFTIGNNTNVELPSARVTTGMLSRIVYPTGGYVDFQFEPNKYNAVANGFAVRQGGGVRIRTITYYDGKSSTAAHQKYYRYGDAEDGLGLVIHAPNKKFNPTINEYETYSYSSTETNISSQGNRRIIRTTYEPASFQAYTYPDGASVYYTAVAEYNMDFGVETGKKVYSYYPPTQFIPLLDTRDKFEGTNVSVLHADGLMGQERAIADYKYENGSFKLLRRKEFNYSKFSLPWQLRVDYAYNNKSQSGGIEGHQICDRDEQGNFVNCRFDQINKQYLLDRCDAYLSGIYGLEIGNVLLTQEIETTVREGSTLTQSTQYYYDNSNYLQPSRVVTTNSEGHQITKTIKHCYDFTDALSVSMKSMNMVSQPLEEIVYNNTLGKEISRVKNIYQSISISQSQSFIAPVIIQNSFGGQSLQTQMSFDKYDGLGNILQVTGRDKIPVTYLWGYNGLYPIAEIKGATYTQVSGTPSTTSFATLIATSDASQIATGMRERRALFPSAMINSFTHKPLVGVSSITDAAGLVTSFDYDNGRLQAVKDKNGDIIKAFDYNTLNSVSGLASYPFFKSNAPQMETFSFLCYQNTPVARYPYNYVVDGGKYNGYVGSDPDFDAAQEMKNVTATYVPPNLNCSSANGEKVSLYNRGIYGVYLDLFKDGSLVYSKPFPNKFVTPEDVYTPIEFYAPPGEYTISLRFERSNYSGLIRLTLTENTSTRYLKSGDSLNIIAGGSCSFNIYMEE